MKILIDGDACPVKGIIMDTAQEFNIPVVLIYSVSHYGMIESFENAEKIMVDNESQAVDMAIMNRVNKGDIVVTGDFGLASLVLSKKAYAVSFNGRIFDETNIDRLLFERHVAAEVRRSGGRVKGPHKRSPEDDKKFMQALSLLILKNLKDI